MMDRERAMEEARLIACLFTGDPLEIERGLPVVVDRLLEAEARGVETPLTVDESVNSAQRVRAAVLRAQKGSA